MLILIPFGAAQQEKIQQLANKGQELTQIAEKLADKQSRTEFLKERWAQFLETTSIGKFFIQTGELLTKANPLFKYLFGLEFSWSWHFILTFFLWIAVGLFAYRLLSFLELWNHGIHAFASFIATSILGVLHIYEFIANWLAKLINTIPSIYLQLIAGVLLIYAFFALSATTKLWESLFLTLKENIKKHKAEKAFETLKKEVAESNERRMQEIEQEKGSKEKGKKGAKGEKLTAEEIEELKQFSKFAGKANKVLEGEDEQAEKLKEKTIQPKKPSKLKQLWRLIWR